MEVKQEGAKAKRKPAPGIGTVGVGGVEYVSKRPKKEIDFHLREMEKYFEMALQCSKEGDKAGTDNLLQHAKRNGQTVHALSDYEARAAEIRRNLNDRNQRRFSLRKMEYNLKYALRCAYKGDNYYMESFLNTAKKYAQEVNALNVYEPKASKIRHCICIIQNERDHNLRKMEDYLGSALRFAKEGAEIKMKLSLSGAKRCAKAASELNDYKRRATGIKKHLNAQNQRGFNLCELDAHLKYSLQYAKEGKTSLEYYLTEANKLAALVGSNDINQRVSEVRCAFYAPEQAVQAQHGAPNMNDLVNSPAASRRFTNGGVRNNDHSNDDDERIEVLGLEEVVAKRVKEAESRGEVITLDD